MNHRISILSYNVAYDTFEDILPSDVNTALDILIVGKTPSPYSVSIGHYFQGRQGKIMWNKLEEYHILKKSTLYHDDSLLANGIGITDIVKVPRLPGHEPTLGEYLVGKGRLLEIIKEYRPKVVFFVYKPPFETMVPLHSKINYGFNDHLKHYFCDSRPFLFPMPGTGKVNKEVITKSMSELEDFVSSLCKQ